MSEQGGATKVNKPNSPGNPSTRVHIYPSITHVMRKLSICKWSCAKLHQGINQRIEEQDDPRSHTIPKEFKGIYGRHSPCYWVQESPTPIVYIVEIRSVEVVCGVTDRTSSGKTFLTQGSFLESVNKHCTLICLATKDTIKDILQDKQIYTSLKKVPQTPCLAMLWGKVLFLRRI